MTRGGVAAVAAWSVVVGACSSLTGLNDYESASGDGLGRVDAADGTSGALAEGGDAGATVSTTDDGSSSEAEDTDGALPDGLPAASRDAEIGDGAERQEAAPPQDGPAEAVSAGDSAADASDASPAGAASGCEDASLGCEADGGQSSEGGLPDGADARGAGGSTAAFGYSPSNFDPLSYVPPSEPTTDCNATYSSTSHSFTAGSCTGAVPTIVPSVTQPGGPPLDILVFGSLTIAGSSTLTITGADPVILAVYGGADVEGTIDADGAPGTTDSTATGASGPGGNYDCGTSTGGNPPNADDNNGGGGGGASAAGGRGAADGDGNTGGAAGAARANASIVPLYGGCPGGNSGSCGHTQSGGGGGGAIQISAAGPLSVTGTISARGGAGGGGAAGSGCGSTGWSGGAGGGSGGAVLLEGSSVTGTGVVTGGAGGAAKQAGGAGGTSASPTGGNGITDTTGTKSGSGGGGGYGYLKIN